ncbi:MAG: AAA family ATPase [Gammaproteobacteria bacterium]|nr:AAA family ATPase [Gammaproteobacteria bacterium]
MHFESVKAHDFGPFHERTLDLAPGMNVIYGPNEAGKSSWHAALYVGLCGMRRGKGQPLKDDREFSERHRPWDGTGAWQAGAVVKLADGHRVELRHDLAGKVDCSAQDADLAGRDYTSDVLFDGSPDGSCWLGLNRKSFLSTACIRQADILRVLGDADSLQQDMQRAAATAGTDATAAEALRRLGEYRTTHVGTRRAPTKPLLVTETKATEASAALEEARARHGEYMRHRADLERLERKALDARLQADTVAAALAEAEAASFEDRLKRVRDLDAASPMALLTLRLRVMPSPHK